MPEKSETKPLELTPYSAWSAENHYEDSIESRARYTEHLASQFFDAGQLTPEVNTSLQQTLAEGLQEDGTLNFDDPESLSKVNQRLNSYRKPTLAESLAFVEENVAPTDSFIARPNQLSISEQNDIAEFKSLVDNGELPEDYNVEEFEEMLRKKRESFIKDAYKSGDIDAGVYFDKNGGRKFVGGQLHKSQNEEEVIRGSRKYGVEASDFLELKYLREADPNRQDGLKRYEVAEGSRAVQEIDAILDESIFADRVAQAQSLAIEAGKKKTYGMVDNFLDGGLNLLDNAVTSARIDWNKFSGDQKEEDQLSESLYFKKKRQEYEDQDYNDVRRSLLSFLEKQTGLKGPILDDALDDYITQLGYSGQAGKRNFKSTFQFDEDSLGRNVSRTKFGGYIVNASLNYKEDAFKQALSEAGATDKEIQIENEKRKYNNELNFAFTDEVLSEEEGWAEAKMEGQQKGLTNSEIVEKFAKESGIDVEDRGVALSLKQSISTLWYGAFALLGSEYGQKGLIQNAQEAARNRQLAQIFGVEMGLWQDVKEQAAPMIVDAALTFGATALAAPTAGASAAGLGAYFTAKTSALATSRALIGHVGKRAFVSGYSQSLKRGLTRNAATGRVVKETSEEVAERLIAAGTFGKLSTEATINAVNAANSQVAKTLGIAAGSFVPAATRSGSMMYGSIFPTVEEDLTKKHKSADGVWDEGWSEERVKQEAHEAAFNGMLEAGVVTGLITSGFGSIGGGKFAGAENMFLKNVSFKNFKVATDRVLGYVSSDKVFKKMVSQSIKSSFIKATGGRLGRFGTSALGEGFEEGLDELINSMVEDAWTNKDRPIRERFEGALHAAKIGMTLGAAAPVVGGALRRMPFVPKNAFNDAQQLLQLEKEVIADFQNKVDAASQKDPEIAKRFERLVENAPLFAREVQAYEEALATQNPLAPSRNTESLTTDVNLEPIEGRKEPQPNPIQITTDAEQTQAVVPNPIEIQGQQVEPQQTVEDDIDMTPEQLENEAKNLGQDLAEAIDNATPEVLEKAVAQEEQVENETAVAPAVAKDENFMALLRTLGIENLATYISSPAVGQAVYQNAAQKYADGNARVKAAEDLYRVVYDKWAALPEGDEKNELLNFINVGRTNGTLLDGEQGKQARQFLDEQLKREKEEEGKTTITDGDKKSFDDIIDAGYPVSIIQGHLDALGLDLDKSDTKALRSASKYIREKIQEKFPPNYKKPSKYAAQLPDLFSTDSQRKFVYLTENGEGVFNNDPQSMLTFFKAGIPISIDIKSEFAQNFGTPDSIINPAFDVRYRDGKLVIVDIFVPVKKGRVSAASVFKRNGAPSHQTDYSRIENILRDVKVLKAQEIAIPDMEIRNPFRDITLVGTSNKDVISLQDLYETIAGKDGLKTMERFVRKNPAIKKLKGIPETSKKKFHRAAAINLQLELQKRIYETASDTVESPSFDVENIRDAEVKYYAEVAAKRLEKAKEDLAVLSRQGELLVDNPEIYDVEKNAQDLGIPVQENPIPTIPQSNIENLLQKHEESIKVVMRDNPEIVGMVDNLLDATIHESKLVSQSRKTPLYFKVPQLIKFLAKGNNISNKYALSLQSELIKMAEGGDTAARDMFVSLKALGLTSPTFDQRSPVVDEQFNQTFRSDLQEAIGPDFELTEEHLGDAHNIIKSGTREVYAQQGSGVFELDEDVIEQNQQQIDELGIRSGDPESVISALEGIVNNKKSPRILRMVAKMLLRKKDFIRSVNFTIEESYDGNAGTYDPNTKTVNINPFRESNGSYGVAGTLIHEYIHAFTADIIYYGKADPAIMKTLDRLRKYVRRRAMLINHEQGMAGTENIEEFLAYMLTNPEFQLYTKKIAPEKRGESKSIFRKIIEAIARLFGPPTPTFDQAMEAALTLTRDADPSTLTGYRKQVAGKIYNQISKQAEIAEELGMVDATQAEIKLAQRAEELADFARNYLPAEILMEIDNNSPVVAKIDGKTGVLKFNANRAAVKVLELVESKGIDRQRGIHIIAAVLNEEIGHAAANQMLTDNQILEVVNSMNDEDYRRMVEEYYPIDQQEEAFNRLRSDDAEVVSIEKYKLANEAIVAHASMAVRGMTTNQQVAFLSTNPSLIPTFIQYLKALLSKLVYHRNSNDISPELRNAVNNVVREIRGMELGYRAAPKSLEYNTRNGDQIIDTLVQQFEDYSMLSPTEGGEVEEEGGPVESTVTTGVYINDSSQPFTDQILKGEKTIETRDNTRLDSAIGKRIGIVRSGKKGGSVVVGYATIGERVDYNTEEDFRADEDLHLVKEGTQYDIKEGKKKYGYTMLDVVEEPNPYPVDKKRNYQFADINTPKRNLDLESQFGADAKMPNFLSPVEMQEKQIGQWLEILDYPIIESGKYDIDAPEDNNFLNKLKRTAIKSLSRRADRNVVRFYDQNVAFVRVATNLVDTFQKKHNTLLAKETKRLGYEIPATLISQATGSSSGTQLTATQEEQVQANYLNALAIAQRKTGVDRQIAEDQAALVRDQEIVNLQDQNRQRVLNERNAALVELQRISPQMYALVVQMRQLQDQLSKKAMSIFKGTMDPADLHLAFDYNRGIYLTRKYRMFEDNNFAAEVLQDPDYANVREEAALFFVRQKKLLGVDQMMAAQGISYQEAVKRIDLDIVANKANRLSEGQAFVREFIEGYKMAESRRRLRIKEGTGTQDIVLEDQFRNSELSQIAQTINEKKNIPDPIRKLLGEYGPEEGINNLSRTMLHTASMISNQSFFNKIKELGMNSTDPWLVTEAQYLSDPDRYSGWRQILPDQGDQDLDPIKGMYVPQHVYGDFVDLFEQGAKDYRDMKNERVQAESAIGSFMRKATGISLAVNTLGSVGFYIRNMLGNALYFGPMQGYTGGLKLLVQEAGGIATGSSASLMVRAAKGSRAELDFELLELQSMNVFGDELEVSQIQNLLAGRQTFSDLQNDIKQVGKLHQKITENIRKSTNTKVPQAAAELLAKYGIVGAKGGMTVKDIAGQLMGLGGRLASAADGFFKIGLYNYELDTLIAAAKAAKDTDPLKRMLTADGKPTSGLKQMAAEIVKDTSQSYSRALPIVKSLTNSSLSVVIAPYIRFAADVPRVMYGGLKRAVQELKSDNPVIKARGRRRLLGAMLTTAGAAATTKGTSMLLFGFDDEDEDKAIRAGLPKWMQKAGLMLVKWKGGIYYFDMSYLNPFANYTEPFIRGFESIVRGEGFEKAFFNTLGSQGVLKPFMSEQILAGAVFDVITNKDDYGNPLFNENDSNRFLKQLNYIVATAYKPRSLAAPVEAIEAMYSDKSDRMFGSPMGILLKEALPIRPAKLDLDKASRYYFRSFAAKNRNNRLNLETSGHMSIGDIEAEYDRFYRIRTADNAELNKVVRGLQKLGMQYGFLMRDASNAGISKTRMKMNFVKMQYRPVMTEPMRKRMLQTNRLRDRYYAVTDYMMREYPQVITPIE